MQHVPTKESYLRKVCRIAKELDISIDEAAITCDASELAFSDQETRQAIFGMIDQLDDSAAKKGEPLGLIITHAVELGMDGIHVGRYADYIPPGQPAELTPANQAMIFLRIKDNFPTQEFLGPLIVNRPDPMSEPREVATGFRSSEGCPERRDGSNDTEITEPVIPTELPSDWPDVPICLGPIRLTFDERFPCVGATKSSSQRAVLPAGMPAFQKALKPHHPLPPWAALPAGMPAFQSSGLSPPPPTGDVDTPLRKMSPGLGNK